MYPEPLIDYYKVLQVHFDASLEVIKAAYRKLSTLFHPDNSHNPKEDARMALINEAYSVLSDSKKRRVYHQQWLSHFTDRNSSTHGVKLAYTKDGIMASRDVLDLFFHSLLTSNWNSAYNLLTLEDQLRISPNQFASWREAVSSCFEMEDYNLQLYRTYAPCRMEDTVYPLVSEFAVTIRDMDLQTFETSKDVAHKYVAFDGNSWKVCLGVRSVKQATLKYKLLAQRGKNYDPVAIYKNAAAHTDHLTGLLSEIGFYQDAKKEVARFQRYHNPFSLVAFQITCTDPSREMSCLCQCASVLHRSTRINDLVARFGNNQIICLLAETTQEQSVGAVEKFIVDMKERQTEPYTINAGIMEFKGIACIEDAVFAVCSDASRQGNQIHINQEHSYS